ncbi:MAG TPA: serine/threonine-protein kinase [Puia sp.]|nr:serine/threonine-protein kinase [Puia sp.]
MLTLQPGDVFADHYQLRRLIDTGGFAEVWEAVFLTAGNTVALKIYPKLDADGVKNIEDEYLNQSELSHSNLLIARYFGKYNGYPFLEMRYCSGGNAAARLGAYSEEEMARCIAQVGSALAYLHANGIVHQDVKPNNFLLDAKGNYYLADLGLSLRVRSTIRKYTQAKNNRADSIYAGVTPPPYRGPELYDRSGTTGSGPVMASDVWALGASLYEMITGDVPLGEFGGLMQLNQPDPPDLPEGFSAGLNYIIKKCLSKDTWDRPRATELQQWAQHYLDHGTYGVPAGTATLQDSGRAGEGGPSKNGGTVRDSTLSVDRTGDGGKGRKNMRWVVIVAAVVLAAFGIKWVVDRNTTPKVMANLGPATSLIVKKDSVGEKVDSSGNSGAAGSITDTNATVKKPIEKAPVKDPIKPTPPTATVIEHPSIGTRPKSGYIDIIRIEKTNTRLNITFQVKRLANNNTITIYGPEDPDHCFYVLAGGQKFRLVSVDKQGKGITFSTDYYIFTASFMKIPDYIRQINVMEGEDQDSPDLNYWNFRDVSVTND